MKPSWSGQLQPACLLVDSFSGHGQSSCGSWSTGGLLESSEVAMKSTCCSYYTFRSSSVACFKALESLLTPYRLSLRGGFHSTERGNDALPAVVLSHSLPRVSRISTTSS